MPTFLQNSHYRFTNFETFYTWDNNSFGLKLEKRTTSDGKNTNSFQLCIKTPRPCPKQEVSCWDSGPMKQQYDCRLPLCPLEKSSQAALQGRGWAPAHGSRLQLRLLPSATPKLQPHIGPWTPLIHTPKTQADVQVWPQPFKYKCLKFSWWGLMQPQVHHFPKWNIFVQQGEDFSLSCD